MKKLILLFSVIFLLASCKQVPTPPEEVKDEKAKENIALVKDLCKAIENEDIEGIKGFVSDSVVSYGPSFGYTESLDEYVNDWTQTFIDIDSMKIDIFQILAETVTEGDLAGDWVLLWSDVSFYFPETGKKVNLMYHSANLIEDGEIRILANYWNQWDMYAQLGAELLWPEE